MPRLRLGSTDKEVHNPAIMAREIIFLLFDGFATLDATGPADVFSAANQAARRTVYAPRYLGRTETVTASSGISIACGPLDAATGAIDTLIVPGGEEAAIRAVQADADMMAHVTGLAQRAQRVASVCSGAFILAGCGLLEGRRATTHWRGLDRLATEHPGLSVDRSALYVEDGAVWTSAGVTAGIDMALALVERDLGHAIALAVARELVLFLVRPGNQAQFSAPLDLQARSVNTDLRDLIPWIEARLAQKISVAAMADAMAMSERSFHRRCLAVFDETPLALVQRLRLDQARTLLEDSALPVKMIAAQAGFTSVALLARQFAARFGIGLKAYRQSFAPQRR